jgi:hypothetical protein
MNIHVKNIDVIPKVFPEIGLIKDKALAKAVAEIWHEMWSESEWDSIEDCPKNPSKDGDLKLVTHTRAVVKLALAMADVIKSTYGDKLTAKTDYILAGALLHDADKLLAYSPASGASKTIYSKQLPTAMYIGYKMLDRGLSRELVNIVVCHSQNRPQNPPITFEGVIVSNADHAESEATRAGRREAGIFPA